SAWANRPSDSEPPSKKSAPPEPLTPPLAGIKKLGGSGFEPEQAVPKTAVLPLHHPPGWLQSTDPQLYYTPAPRVKPHLPTFSTIAPACGRGSGVESVAHGA